MSRLEEVHRRNMQAVRTDVQGLADRLTAEETARASLEDRVNRMEKEQMAQAAYTSSIQLRLEESEDRGASYLQATGDRGDPLGVGV